MSVSTETHSYDGKLTHIEICEPTLSLEQCVQEVTSKCADSHALQAVQLIASGVGNMDNSNNLCATYVFRASWERVRDIEQLFPLYFEQLADIVLSGSCPQGRTTRLMQFLL